jgi:two-component system chemotaxis sensor kinase CheA
MDTGDFRDLFVSEAQEYLNALNHATLRLEKNPADIEAVHTLFRAAHTLKGMAATMGFDGITHLTHEFESALDQIRSGAQAVYPELINLLFEGIDELSKLIGEVTAGHEAREADAELLERVRQAAKGFQATAKAAPVAPPPLVSSASPAEGPTGSVAAEHLPKLDSLRSLVEGRLASGAPVLHVKVGVDPRCAFKGVRAFLVRKNLEKVGTLLGTLPAGKQLEAGDFDLTFDVWLESDRPDDEILLLCTKVMEIAGADVERLENPAAAAPTLAAPLAAQETLFAAPLPPLAPAAPTPEAKAPAPREATVAKQTVRVSVERLDRIMNMVGELVTSKIRLGMISKNHAVKDLSDAIVQFEHIVNELQEEAMAARMVPMEQVFNRFPRMVRDLARELGKEVDLELVGSEIELDRTILDEITDPLVHLLRNSIDHGLELPELRSKAGKSGVGTVRLEARREKNQVVITVQDDGAGIQTDKVRAAAVRKGLMSPEQARALSEDEAINLISLPGFSTTETVTAVSGRGVGVDAVRTKVEALGGSLKIESNPGLGSSFRVRLPLTLAIIQALLVRVGKEEYAAPVSNVVEVVEYAPSELRSIHGQEVVMLREEVLPVFRLYRLLEVPGVSERLPSNFSVLIVEAGERRAGLIVDEVMGQLEIAIKGLGRYLKSIRGFGGVTILGDGRICLILDFSSLLEL